jgi:hypothetical protein
MLRNLKELKSSFFTFTISLGWAQIIYMTVKNVTINPLIVGLYFDRITDTGVIMFQLLG